MHYRSRKGEFARSWIFAAAKQMPSYEWWDQYGASVPELQAVACIILSQPSSASIIERINSEFAFVKDRHCPANNPCLPGVNPNPNPIPNPNLRRRNRLGHEKSNKLVALFHNLRLLKKMRKLLYSEPCFGWNEEEEKTGAS